MKGMHSVMVEFKPINTGEKSLLFKCVASYFGVPCFLLPIISSSSSDKRQH